MASWSGSLLAVTDLCFLNFGFTAFNVTAAAAAVRNLIVGLRREIVFIGIPATPSPQFSGLWLSASSSSSVSGFTGAGSSNW